MANGYIFISQNEDVCMIWEFVHILFQLSSFNSNKPFHEKGKGRVLIQSLTTQIDWMLDIGLTIMVIPHTKKVNVDYRLHFELTESFG